MGRDRELAALADAHTTRAGAVILGTSGSGRSHLLRTHLEALAQAGTVPATSIEATDAAASLPLGAFAHVLPALPDDPAARLRAAATHLASLEGPVVVDDAHLLDAVSVALLHHLRTVHGTTLLLTVRSDVATDATLAGLCRDHLRRITLDDLDEPATASLVAHVVGGPLLPTTRAEIWRLTHGHPASIRAVVTTATEDGAWERRDGRIHGTLPLPVPPAVDDTVRMLLRELPSDERDALELVALADPAPVTLIEALDLTGPTEALEERGLVRGATDTDGPALRVHPPLHAASVRASTPVMRRRRALRQLATQAATIADTDPLRAARWKLEAGLLDDADLFCRASVLARASDLVLAARLGEAAAAAGAPGVGGALQAEALATAGDVDAARRVIDDAMPAARTDSDRVSLAVAATRCIGLHGGQPLEARGRADHLRRDAEDPGAIDAIDTALGVMAAIGGDLPTIRDVVDRTLARDDTSTEALTMAHGINAYALVMTGPVDAADAAITRATEQATILGDPFYLGAALTNRLNWYALAGHTDQAVATSRALLEQALADGDEVAAGLFSFWSGLSLELAGDLNGAARLLADAQGVIDRNDPLGLRIVSPAVMAVIAAQRGDEPAASSRAATNDHPTDARARFWRQRARIWALGCRAQVDAAVTLASRAGRDLADQGWTVWAATALHDAVRLQRPDAVADALADTAAAAGALPPELLGMYADHARAAADGDAAELDDVAARFAAAGMFLLAAEAAGHASIRHTLAGSATLSARSATRADGWRVLCPGAATPGLLGWRSDLTPREREIAALASSGSSSRDIADRLAISIRTVDNHLASVYRKLGVEGRGSLETALGTGVNGG